MSIATIVDDVEALIPALEGIAAAPADRGKYDEAHARLDILVGDLEDAIWGTTAARAALRSPTPARFGDAVPGGNTAVELCRAFVDRHKMQADPNAVGAGTFDWQAVLRIILTSLTTILAGG